MEVIVEQMDLPECGLVELNLNRTFTIKISAAEARRKVNGWLLDYVSYMIGARMPTLIVGEQVYWRVPAVFTTPDLGEIGVVGTIKVNAETGEMNSSIELGESMRQCARELGKKLPPYKPRTHVPAEYLATDLKPTHTKPTKQQRQSLMLLSAVTAD